MKKKNKLLLSISIVLAGLALSLGVISGVSKTETSKVDALYTPSTTYNVSDTQAELNSYYSSVTSGQTGDTLLSTLRSINSSKYHKNFSYSNFGTSSTTSPYVYTDYPIGTTTKDSNGQIRGSEIASFYTKTTATSYNKEHVWPNSKGGNKVEDDILMPRPTISSENSSRGNSNFVEGMNSSSGGWDPYTAGYDKECRGECARIMLYCVVASSQLSLVASDSGGSTSCGNMNTLVKWHFDYAPSEYEMNRNNGAEYLQGNRNPFVDHPEYVARIWSNFNSTVSNLCTQNEAKYSNWIPGNYCKYGENTPVDTSGVTISKNSDSLTVGESTTISATSTDSSTISWTTSNSSVVSLSSSSSASGSNITLTANGAGTATITAKATISGTQYTNTCTITVTKVVSSLSKGSTSPTKTVYTAGDHFDPTGLTITATYSDSTQGDVTSSVVWSPDPLTQGITSVTGTYGGKSVVVSGITVNQATEPVLVTSNSTLSNGDSVIIRTNESTPKGVTGCGSKDATVSTTQAQWVQYVVGSASSSGWTLYDSAEQQYIASPGANECKYSSDGGTCYVDSEGHLMCNNRYLCVNGTNYRFYTSIGSYTPFYVYKVPGSSSVKTLSTISVATAPTKTTYVVDEYFNPTGLVINRNYSDSTTDTYTYANHTSEFTFTPSTSTALTVANTSVTITYGGKSCLQTITVSTSGGGLSEPTSITASVSKTYYVGETISTSDITVEDNNGDEVEGFSFAIDGYQFIYSDAASGGALTNKTFTNSITYNALSCSLTVQVQRKARTDSSSAVKSVSYTDLPTTYQTSTTERTAVSGVKFIAYNCANYSSKMQFKASGGYFQTTQAMNLVSLAINNRESNALTVYGSTNGTSFSQSITGSNDVYNLSGYSYFKVIKNGSGAAYCSSLSISVAGSDSAVNLSNYIMYEDTNNQCVSKLPTAMGYLKNLSSTEKSTFETSDDYLISTARERLEAWALNQGKEINYSSGELTSKSNTINFGENYENSALLPVIFVVVISLSSLTICILIKKRRIQK